jgi:hypothetical protein
MSEKLHRSPLEWFLSCCNSICNLFFHQLTVISGGGLTSRWQIQLDNNISVNCLQKKVCPVVANISDVQLLGHDLCILPHAIIGIVMRIFQRLCLSFSLLCFNDLFGGHTVLVCALESLVDLHVRLFTASLDPVNCCKLQLLLGHLGLVNSSSGLDLSLTVVLRCRR